MKDSYFYYPLTAIGFISSRPSTMHSIALPRFTPPRGLKNPHVQTVLSHLFAVKVLGPCTFEQVPLPDGDFLEGVWSGAQTGPITIILHGITGSFQSPYVPSLLNHFGLSRRFFFMHFRACGPSLNRQPRLYHGGDSDDLADVIAWIRQKTGEHRITAIGFSLGANVLTKYMGEQGDKALLNAGIAVSTPFDLHTVTYHTSIHNRYYERMILKSWCQLCERKFKSYRKPPIALHQLPQLMRMYEFDDLVTAPLHGFESADHYYSQASARYYLKTIKKPMWFLNALDDPIVIKEVLPPLSAFSESCTVYYSDYGGHNGFVSAGLLPRTRKDFVNEFADAFFTQYSPHTTGEATPKTA
ncbi:MAG: alpha/beta fold hydrolase [Pseudomonadota bacterium]|nr:alpha/beta fold hydrolase [Pseudomonadota bacterium]